MSGEESIPSNPSNLLPPSSSVFSIRIIVIEHAVTTPGPLDFKFNEIDPGASFELVPVLRVFGITPQGKRACVHLHQIYPYFFIPYDGDTEEHAVAKYIYILTQSINAALTMNLALHQSKTSYVAGISLVKGVPFYGYHATSRFFLKIYLTDPTLLTKVADLCLSGAIMHTVFQPYESHLPYTSQFLLDFRLYGMGWLHLRQCHWRQHRQGGPSSSSLSNPVLPPIPSSLSSIPLIQETYSEWEVDATGFDIHVPPFTRAVQSLETYWEEEAQRRQLHELPPLTIFKCSFEQSPAIHTTSSSSSSSSSSTSFLDPHDYSLPGSYSKEIQLSQPVLEDIKQTEALWPEMTQSLLAWMLEHQHSQNQTVLPSKGSLDERYEIKNEQEKDKDDDDEMDLPPLFQFEEEEEHAISTAFLPPPSLPQFDGSSDIPTQKKKVMKVSVNIPPPPRSLFELLQSSQPLRLVSDPSEILRSSLKKKTALSVSNSLESMRSSASSLYKPDQPSPTVSSSSSLNETSSSTRRSSFGRLIRSPHSHVTKLHQPTKPSPSITSSNFPSSSSLSKKTSSKTSIPSTTATRATKSKPKRDAFSALKRFQEFQKYTKQSSAWSMTKSGSKHASSSSRNAGIKKVMTSSRKPTVLSTTTTTTVPSSSHPSTLPLPFTQKKSLLTSPHPIIEKKSVSTQTPLETLSTNLLEKEAVVPFSAYSSSSSFPSSPSSGLESLPLNFSNHVPSNQDPISSTPTDPIVNSTPKEGSMEVMVEENLTSPSQVSISPISHVNLHPSLPISPSLTLKFVFTPPPPTLQAIEAQFLELNLPLQLHSFPRYHHDPFTSNLLFQPFQEYSDFHECLFDTLRLPRPLYTPLTQSTVDTIPILSYLYAPPPPTVAQALQSLLDLPKHSNYHKKMDRSQIEIKEALNGGSFQPTPRHQANTSTDKNGFKCMIIEIHVITDDKLLPNPVTDEIQFISYGFGCDSGVLGTNDVFKWGLLVNSSKDKSYFFRNSSTIYPSEFDMILGLIDLVRNEDPDALLGYNLRSYSWGYVFERALRAYALDLNYAFSRIIQSGLDSNDPQLVYRKASSFKPTGRLLINVWRWFQDEVANTDYTIENMCQVILKRRIPRFPFHVLTGWWQTQPHRVIEYYVVRVQVCWELLVNCDFIHRTSEFAKTYGIDFNSVLTRGSQFRVESTLLRITRQLHFLLISPSRAQVANQRAAECIPLVMEPESSFYADPVIVLDFQALYPSVMIAYNICYSTCIGKTPKKGSTIQKLGFVQYSCPTNFKEEDLHVAPTGIMFVKPHIRKSVLAAMLTELLETRLMVKQSMKLYKSDKILSKVLDTRQLCLKLLSNVTYGYTAASFSGRMPLVEVGDAIVSIGRTILENAIQMISQHPTWGARVVYGDTDSLFVQVANATKERAFQIGREIAEAVTKANQPPIKLNFEKVYFPCVLITKKRYIGYKFENESDTVPIFDAKGIETVRRDGCPAVAKILRRSLEILFDTRDLTQLKSYVQRQFMKILEHRVSPKDFIIAKEVKLGSYSDRTLPPPGAYLSLKKMERDPRAEPSMRERVPYVIIYGAPGDRLIDQVMLVHDFLDQPNMFLNGQYYIHHLIIPALQRIFELLSVDIQSWFNEVKKPIKSIQYSASERALKKHATIDQYYNQCICGNKSISNGICQACVSDPHRRTSQVLTQLKIAEQRYQQLSMLCFDCIQFQDREIECDSLACDVLFDRIKARRRVHELWSQSEQLFIDK